MKSKYSCWIILIKNILNLFQNIVLDEVEVAFHSFEAYNVEIKYGLCPSVNIQKQRLTNCSSGYILSLVVWLRIEDLG